MKSDKFKNMSRRELAEYVWDYYKVHIIAGLAILFVLGSLLNTLVLNPAKKGYISVVVYGEHVPNESISALEELLTDVIVPSELRSGWKIAVDNFYMDDYNPMASMALAQKFAALLMSGELDILIASLDVFDEMLFDGMFLPLDGIMPDRWASMSIMGTTDEEPSLKVYGVNITGSSVLEACGLIIDRPAVGIIVSSKQWKTAIDGINILVPDR